MLVHLLIEEGAVRACAGYKTRQKDTGTERRSCFEEVHLIYCWDIDGCSRSYAYHANLQRQSRTSNHTTLQDHSNPSQQTDPIQSDLTTPIYRTNATNLNPHHPPTHLLPSPPLPSPPTPRLRRPPRHPLHDHKVSARRRLHPHYSR